MNPSLRSSLLNAYSTVAFKNPSLSPTSYLVPSKSYAYIATSSISFNNASVNCISPPFPGFVSSYPRTMHEYETRRDYQNAAIVNCEQLVNELQRVVEIFDVDLNLYNRYVKAIDREIGLIKRWRQRDMAIKSRLEKGNI